MNVEEHLDIDALQDLKEIMENEFETLVNTFVMDSQSKLQELDGVVADNDAESIRKLAHSLKGSSSNVCAFKLSEYARQLEAMGKDEKTDGALNVLRELKLEFEIITQILNDNL
ncbi:MAG: Hpt domain-containing protein [Pseudomonadales bacterium]|nr:Hpt domain-containing protein [Pseudomonadales bacterium]